jgi:hypothetical protein
MGINAKKWDMFCREEGIGSADPRVGVAITK